MVATVNSTGYLRIVSLIETKILTGNVLPVTVFLALKYYMENLKTD